MRIYLRRAWDWTWRLGPCANATTSCAVGLLRGGVVTRMEDGTVLCEDCLRRATEGQKGATRCASTS